MRYDTNDAMAGWLALGLLSWIVPEQFVPLPARIIISALALVIIGGLAYVDR